MSAGRCRQRERRTKIPLVPYGVPGMFGQYFFRRTRATRRTSVLLLQMCGMMIVDTTRTRIPSTLRSAAAAPLSDCTSMCPLIVQGRKCGLSFPTLQQSAMRDVHVDVTRRRNSCGEITNRELPVGRFSVCCLFRFVNSNFAAPSTRLRVLLFAVAVYCLSFCFPRLV